jgi:anthranilate phosphoribosyltransferase
MSADLSWPTLLSALLRGEQLTTDQTAWAMEEVMSGEATPVQVAGFVVALRAKGETAAEVAGLVTTMLRYATRVDIAGPTVDTCGTGGDRAHTVNISTMAAIVVAAAGGRVVKHGNRAASSACGSADLLEELGVAIDLPPAGVVASVEEAGIGFCFAPLFHPALRHAGAARRELGVATVFNFLGPLANPAQPRAQAVGVADARMAPVLAQVLADRGTSALVFRGEDGLDELTTTGPSRIWTVRDGIVKETRIEPDEVGLEPVPAAALRGADAAYNAGVTRKFLAGEEGPVRDAVLLNAAAALVAIDPGEDPLAARLAAEMRRGAEVVDSGAAMDVLERWIDVSRQAAGRTG